MKIITWWILGFVIGFACAEFATLVCTGKFIHLANWRKPYYIYSLSDLVDNVKRAATFFLKDLRSFSHTTQVLCVAAILHAGWKWFKGARQTPWVIGLLLLVATSVYAQSIPAGINVSTRSAACLFLATIGLLFFSFRNRKTILVACAILVALPLYKHNVDTIEIGGTIMRVWKTDLEKIPVGAQSVDGIALISSDDETIQHVNVLRRRFKFKPITTESRGWAWRWIPAAYENGFRRILHGSWDKDFLTKRSLDPDKVERFERCGIYEYAVLDNWLLVRFAQ